MRKRVSAIVCIALIATMVLAIPAEAYAVSWSTGFKRIATKAIVNQKGYYGLQALAFDTYTGKDGYCFTTTNNEKKVALIHFTMNSNGKCKKKKVVVYKSANIGHANDATVFKDSNGKKWILVTLYGSTDDTYTVKSSNGNKIQLGAISIDEYNNGKAIIHECRLNGVFVDGMLKGKLTGITFVGNDTFKNEICAELAALQEDTSADEDTTQEDTSANESVAQDNSTAANISYPCFVLNGGDKYVKAYLASSDNGVLVFNAVGIRGRIVKPKLSNGKAAKFQGIAYHKGYIYILADGSTSMPTAMMICRIKMSSLFNGTDRYQKNTEVFRKKITKQGTLKLKKNAPESICFTNLEGKSRIYLSVNRKNKKNNVDADAIIRSTKTY